MIRALKLHPPSHPHFIFCKAFSFVFLSFLSFLWSCHMSSPFTCAQSTCSLFSASSFILLSQHIETGLGSLSSSFHTGFFFSSPHLPPVLPFLLFSKGACVIYQKCNEGRRPLHQEESARKGKEKDEGAYVIRQGCIMT